MNMKLGLILTGAAALSIAFAASAQAKVFDFSFTGDNGVSGSGVFTTGAVGSPFTVTNVSGTVTDDQGVLAGTGPFLITGVTVVNGYAANDNLLFVPASGSPTAFVDFGGISFNTNNAALAVGPQFNLGGGGTNASGTVLNDSANDPGGFPGTLGSNNISLSVTAVPEPATWAVMLVGFGGLGVAMRSRRKQAAAAA
jgi:hypothetical protein